MSKKLTKEAYEKLKEKFHHMETVERKKVSKDLEKAASYGDLSENGAWDAAKDAQNFLEGRIRKLKEIIRNAEVVGKGESGIVSIGSKITVKSNGKEEGLEIVAFSEADPQNGKISSESPIGKAFIGKKKGDRVEVEVPKGSVEYEIIKVE